MLNADAVNGWRAAAASVIRLVAIGQVVWGGVLFVKKVAFGIGTAQPEMIWNVYEGVGEEHSLYRGAALLTVGVVLGLTANHLARWAIRPPAAGCPGCGYEKWDGTCPECGLVRGGPATRPSREPSQADKT